MERLDRRTFLALTLASLAACGSSKRAATPPAPSGTTATTAKPTAAGVARSSVARVAAPFAESAPAVTVVDDFGVDMYNALTSSAPTPTNLVFSPASIAVALAMTLAGAKGATATEMQTVLHVTDAASLPAAMNALTTVLDSRTQQVPIPGAAPAQVTLNIVNSLWAQADLAFESAFLDLLASHYGAGLQLVDYKNHPEDARTAINAWVDAATKDRIPQLLAPGAIDADTRLALVNAIYMKAPWLNSFSKSSTTPIAFTTAAGTSVMAPTMRATDHLSYSKGAGWQAIELPYEGDELSMMIVLPDAGGSLQSGVAALAGLAAAAASKKVNVSLPKFDITTSVGLADVLTAMGMPTAFDRDKANFSGMTTAAKLFIGAVIHQANITVDEDGTEAAAATAVVMEATAAAPVPEEIIDFIVDRPFVFAIRDNPSNSMLFVGHIVDPTKK